MQAPVKLFSPALGVAVLTIVGALVLAFALASCDAGVPSVSGAAAPSATAAAGRPFVPMAVVTAAPGTPLALPAPPAAAAVDPASARPMLAQLFPGPYVPVEQDVYVTRQATDAVKSFYIGALQTAGYAPEVSWTDMSKESSGASWAKGDIQARVILSPSLPDTRVGALNSTFKLTASALQAGDTLIYVIGIDRSRPAAP